MKRYKFFAPLRKWTALGFIALVWSFCIWLFFAAKAVPLPSEKNPIYFYSNQCRQDLKETLLVALKSAKKSIYLQMYAVTDPAILDLLQEMISKGVAITLFYDRSATSHLEKKLSKNIYCYPVHTRGLMHRKILIIDEETVFLGSANLTTQSLRMHDNLFLGLYSKELSAFLLASNLEYFEQTLNSQELKTYLLPDGGKQALSKLISLIDGAQKNIRIAMFTLTHPVLTEALIAAHKRGVDVSIAVDYYTAKGASLKTLEILQKAGIRLFSSRGFQLLHHKMVYIDDSILALGSANWTRSAFEKNQDCLLVLSPLNQDQRSYMEKLWKILKLESK